MFPDFDSRLRVLAEVVVQVGLNLQPGQPLLITDPYDLLGVHPEAMALAEAIKAAAPGRTSILAGDPAALRQLVEADDLPGYTKRIEDHTRWLRGNLARGGAFLFLTGSVPRLFAGLPPERLARFEVVKWNHFGPLIQQLVGGLSQWTLVPAPSNDWAAAAARPLAALWEIVFAALRIGEPNAGGSLSPDMHSSGHKAPPTSGNAAVAAWQVHLAGLNRQRDELNARRHHRIRYHGPGTDLTVGLPGSHAWCTTQLVSTKGIPFVTNLPTEEIFTAPHKKQADGTVRVARPVAHNGEIIAGVELEFRAGRVVRAKAATGQDHLIALLATDNGSNRLGEIAIVPDAANLAWSKTAHHHILLDENAGPHIALGSAYRFCSRAWLPLAINSSQLHLDLPLDAVVELS